MAIDTTINGKAVSLQAEPDTPLLWVIREEMGLTGTKFGCGIAACGACSVHVNGEITRSCSVPVSDVAGKSITTIEGLKAKTARSTRSSKHGSPRRCRNAVTASRARLWPLWR